MTLAADFPPLPPPRLGCILAVVLLVVLIGWLSAGCASRVRARALGMGRP